MTTYAEKITVAKTALNEYDGSHEFDWASADRCVDALRALVEQADSERATADEREALASLLMRWEDLHHDKANLMAAAILASDVWRNRRQEPITDAEVEAAARALQCVWRIPDDEHPLGHLCRYEGACLDRARIALTAARDAS